MIKSVFTKLILTASVGSLIVGCSMPHVVKKVSQEEQYYDCQRLYSEIQEAQKYYQLADKENAFKAKHIIGGFLLVPGIVTMYSVDKALRAADKRKTELTTLYQQKNCAGNNGAGQRPGRQFP